jgi:hypothetical protein
MLAAAPFRWADPAVDANRLPKAVQASLSNYRGAKVSASLMRQFPLWQH